MKGPSCKKGGYQDLQLYLEGSGETIHPGGVKSKRRLLLTDVSIILVFVEVLVIPRGKSF